MVGVAGRSKGCRNCRRKKKGCDLQKPHCGQCQRSRVTCEGYERDLIIVQYVADNPSPPADHVRSPGSTWSGAQDAARFGDSLYSLPRVDTWVADFSCMPLELFNNEMFQVLGMEDSSRAAVDLRSDPASPRTLADGDLLNSMSEFQIVQGLWEVSYPLVHPRLDVSGLNMGYWRAAVEELFDRSLAVKHGLLAVAFTDAARRSGNRNWATEAMKHYTIALGDTNRALSDPQRQTSDAVLAACKLLSLYESGGGSSNAGQSSGPQGGSNWDNHVVGECKVLRMRGPESLGGEAAFLLFTDLRMLAVAYGFKKRKRIFFDDEEWQTLPFEGHTKDIRQLLVDNAVQHPGLHEEIDSLQALLQHSVASTSTQRRYFDLIADKLIRLRGGLDDWWDLVQRMVPPRIIESMEQGIPDTFSPMDQAFAHTMCFYWTMMMSVTFSTCQVHQFAQEHPELLRRSRSVSSASPEPASSRSYHLLRPIEEAYAEAHLQALRIAYSAPYFFQPAAGVYGSTAFTFPMTIAISYFAATHNTSSPGFIALKQAFERPSVVAPVVKNFVISGQRALNSASADVPNVGVKEGEVWFGVHGIGGEVVVF